MLIGDNLRSFVERITRLKEVANYDYNTYSKNMRIQRSVDKIVRHLKKHPYMRVCVVVQRRNLIMVCAFNSNMDDLMAVELAAYLLDYVDAKELNVIITPVIAWHKNSTDYRFRKNLHVYVR